MVRSVSVILFLLLSPLAVLAHGTSNPTASVQEVEVVARVEASGQAAATLEAQRKIEWLRNLAVAMVLPSLVLTCVGILAGCLVSRPAPYGLRPPARSPRRSASAGRTQTAAIRLAPQPYHELRGRDPGKGREASEGRILVPDTVRSLDECCPDAGPRAGR